MKNEQKVYICLCERQGRQYTVGQIAKILGMPRSTVQKALTKLRNDRLVERDLGYGNGYLWRA